jgi:hypothetical protein
LRSRMMPVFSSLMMRNNTRMPKPMAIPLTTSTVLRN